MTEVYVNGMTVVHQGDGLQFVAMAPDVCKTPSPGGPVPLPYPNIALSTDLADGTKTIDIGGHPAAIASSKLATSTGDEAGSAGGGVISNKIKGALKWMLYSIDVKFEGKGVVRFLDDNLHNGNAGNTSGKNLGKMAIPPHDGDIVCDNCQQPLPGHPQLKPSSESDHAAQKVPGRTVASVVVACPKQKPAIFNGIAGSHWSALTPNTFDALAKNFKYGTKISASSKTDGSASAGNCAEQKALYDAFAAGRFPPGEGCTASMSAMREKSGAIDKRHVRACPTCQRVLTSMLCTNEPKAPK